MLTSRLWFPWIFFLPFLYKGVISACSRISGNVGNFMELLAEKITKKSGFSCTTFIGM